MALVSTIADVAPSGNRRRSARLPLSLEILAGTRSDDAVPAAICDLSQTGFRMESDALLHPGELLQLHLPQVPALSARVIWKCGRHFGCEFQRPLSQAALGAAKLKATPLRSTELPKGLVIEPQGEALPPLERSTHARVLTLVSLSAGLWLAIAAAAGFARL